jgi:hypothetical protein
MSTLLALNEIQSGTNPSGVPCVFFPLTALAASLWWIMLFRHYLGITRLASPLRNRLSLFLIPVTCFGLVFFVSAWVRPLGSDWPLVPWLAFLGLGFMTNALDFLGISPQSNVVERRNMAVAWAIGGAQFGFSLCFIGVLLHGPNMVVVVLLTLLGGFGFPVLGTSLDRMWRIGERIIVGRDLASGCRWGCFLAAIGFLIGDASARLFTGKTSFFLVAEINLLIGLFTLAVVLDRLIKWTDSTWFGFIRDGIIPGFLYLALAATCFALLRAPS